MAEASTAGGRARAVIGWLFWLGLAAGCGDSDANGVPAPSLTAGVGAAGSGGPTSAVAGSPGVRTGAAGTAAGGGNSAGSAARPGMEGAAGSGGRVSAGAAAANGGAGAAGAVECGSGGAADGAAAVGGSSGGAGVSGSGGASSAAAAGGGASSGGAGASGAGDGAAGSAGDVSGSAAPVPPPCLEKDSQLIVIGDSYVNWIAHTFPEDFRRESGLDYRMYGVGGASMGSGGITGLIPDQLTLALSEGSDIIASVMTGGGNDILIADAFKYPGSETCKDRTDSATLQVCRDVIAAAMSAAMKLMQTAADAGIKDVIYMFYPHIPGGGFGGMNPNYILDYALPMARDLCEGAEARTSGGLRCHFIDLQPLFEGHSDWFATDGIHENSTGSAAMAKEVVRVMKEHCIAQPAASGCCTP